MKDLPATRFDVVLNIPSPYRIHLLRVLDEELRMRGAKLHVHFMAEGHAERPASWRNPQVPFSHTYWKDFGRGSWHFNPGLVLHLWRTGPCDYLVTGTSWSTFTGIALALICPRRTGILWAEGNTKTPGRLDGLPGLFKRLVLRQYDFAAVPGSEGAAYIGLHQKRTALKLPTPVVLPNLIDETMFKPRAEWPAEDILQIRNQFNVGPAEKLAISPARLEPVKGFLEFIGELPVEALAGWRWLIIGEGSLKADITRLLESRGLTERVTIVDYMPYDRMPLLYAAADLFVLPSVYDPNPLSVIEAMHSGLPLLLSSQVGNFPEALLEGQTGWGFSPAAPSEIRTASHAAFTASDDLLRRCGMLAKQQATQVWCSTAAIRRFLDQIGLHAAIT
jgi:glycosyltransferase involved in cell wall biosynthesis